MDILVNSINIILNFINLLYNYVTIVLLCNMLIQNYTSSSPMSERRREMLPIKLELFIIHIHSSTLMKTKPPLFSLFLSPLNLLETWKHLHFQLCIYIIDIEIDQILALVLFIWPKYRYFWLRKTWNSVQLLTDADWFSGIVDVRDM